jgi:crotonobetainyl-CoA:carnitine CoA-transferase CaiB-like acyl-CoA transferase
LKDTLLADLVVVEISHPLTEYAGCVLAGLGADVYLIEPPGGAAIRQRRPGIPFAGHDSPRSSLAFLTRNVNKRSVVIDPTSDEDRDLLSAMCARADVVLEAGDSALNDIAHQVQPGVSVSITDEGRLGVSSIVGFAASGGLASSGWPHQPPCNAPGWLPLDGASIYAASVALIGTYARRRGSRPIRYEIPYEEAAIAAITPWTRPLFDYGTEAAGQGIVTRRLGPGGFPIYPARDGFVRVLVATPRQWDAFVKLMGSPEDMVSGPWSDPEFRRTNADALQLICTELTRSRTVSELFHEGQRLGLTITPVSSLTDFRNDPHIVARELFVPVDDPEFGPMELMRPPALLGDEALQCDVIPAPGLGDHQQAAFELIQRPLPAAEPSGGRTDLLEAPLQGLRVLELGVGAVVPEAAALLASFGAEIIKVESRVNPDFLRRQGMNGPDDVDGCPTFNQLNLGVKSIAVNMADAAGRRQILRLLPHCDIVMENMRGGVVAKWGLDYDRARELREDIIYLSSQGLGRGPYDGYQTFGPNLQTFSGVTSQWAHPDDPHPVGTTLNHPDHMAGKQALLPLLAALLRRERTRQGAFIEAAQVETAAYLIGDRFLEQQFRADELPPEGNVSRSMAPHGCYPCAGEDRWVAIAVETDQAWQRLVGIIGTPPPALSGHLAELTSGPGRLEHGPLLDQWLAAWTREKTVEQVERALRELGVACSRVVVGSELAADDALHGSGFFVELDHPRMGPKVYTGLPVLLVGQGRVPVSRPPLLGEHTREVLGHCLAVDEEELSSLQSTNAIGF